MSEKKEEKTTQPQAVTEKKSAYNTNSNKPKVGDFYVSGDHNTSVFYVVSELPVSALRFKPSTQDHKVKITRYYASKTDNVLVPGPSNINFWLSDLQEFIFNPFDPSELESNPCQL